MNTIYDFFPDGGLSQFMRDECRRITSYLMRHYQAGEDDAYDAFQNGCMALLGSIEQGKLQDDKGQEALAPYLMRCCTLHMLKIIEKRKGKYMKPIDDFRTTDNDGEVKEWSGFSRDENEEKEEKEEYESDLNLMKDIVVNLPEPCNKLLWGKYYEKHSLQTMVELYGIRNVNVAKTTLSRCRKKLELRFKSTKKEDEYERRG